MEPLRIATMLPSATEIVCALGYRDYIVATSHEWDYPGSIRNLPSCTGTKIDITGKVERIEGSGPNSKITILFFNNVRKKLIYKYANLEVIEWN